MGDTFTEEISTQLKDAVSYKVELGLSIVSAPRGHKFPTPWDKDYDNPPENLAPYFSRGDENIIAFTGQQHNLIALDFDLIKDVTSPYFGKFIPRVQEVMDFLLKLDKKPWVVKSPRGGKQFRYRPDPAHPIPQRNGIIPGMDARTGKGVLPCPPSVFFNPETKEYAHYINETDPFIDSFDIVPYKELIELVPELLEKPVSTKEIYEKGVVPEGNRDSWLMHMAGILRRQTSMWESVLFLLNESMCKPPLKKDQVEKIIKSASRYSAAIHPEVEFKEVPSKLFTTFQELKTKDVPKPKFLIDGKLKILENAPGLIFGPTAQCKSFVLAALIPPWSEGQCPFGTTEITTIKSKILLVSTEHSEGLDKDRLEHLGGLDSPNAARYDRAYEFEIENEKEVELLLNTLVEYDFDVVVFDVQSDLYSGDDSTSRDVGKLRRFYRKILALGKTPIGVAHTRKGKMDDNLIEAIRGSGDLGNKTASVVCVRKKDEETILVKCVKSRASEELKPIELKMLTKEGHVVGFKYIGPVETFLDVFDSNKKDMFKDELKNLLTGISGIRKKELKRFFIEKFKFSEDTWERKIKEALSIGYIEAIAEDGDWNIRLK